MRRALELFAKLKVKNPGLDTLDVGGGAGVPYEKKKKYYTAKSVVSHLIRAAKKQSERLGIKHPNLIVEWGRYVAAPSQITIYKVITEKRIENKSDTLWYSVDGSFINDLSDTWAIHQKWHVVPVNEMNKIKMKKVWLAGSSCDSDDRYTGGDYILLPRFEDIDELYIAVFDTGAYQDPLASHHCLLSSPAKLVAANGEIKQIRRRETPEEIGKMFGW
jgi:diaminopimelate decarboxylase